jgi:multicomponent Na+:H+ antiporter subunit E
LKERHSVKGGLVNQEGLENPHGNTPENFDVGNTSSYAPQRKRIALYPFFVTIIILLGVWVLLSGKFDLFHLSLGIISCSIVAFLSSDLFFPSKTTKGLFVRLVRWMLYLPWLMVEIVKANLHVTYLVFHPRMMDLIDPKIIKFKSKKLKSDMALVTFANSITLTPGTITVDVSLDGDFKVHAIDSASGDPLPGEMEARIAKTFGDN